MTEETARRTLVAVCERVGFDPANAELIRIGSNAVYRLAKPVIVRISRDGETVENARRQVAVARWLASESYPATRALDVDQPIELDGHVTTLWESASEQEEYAPIAQVAELIRRLHELEAPPSLALPLSRSPSWTGTCPTSSASTSRTPRLCASGSRTCRAGTRRWTSR